MADLNQILARFGFVTVMKPKILQSWPKQVNDDPIFEIDSLRISNITQEGPSKTVKGGLRVVWKYANEIRKNYASRKEDVVGRIDVLQYLMGSKGSLRRSYLCSCSKNRNFTAAGAVDAFLLSFTPDTPPAVVAWKRLQAGVTTLTVTTHYTVVGKLVTLTSFYSCNWRSYYSYIQYWRRGCKSANYRQVCASISNYGTNVIDSVTGNKEWINIYIPQFLTWFNIQSNDGIWGRTSGNEYRGRYLSKWLRNFLRILNWRISNKLLK